MRWKDGGYLNGVFTTRGLNKTFNFEAAPNQAGKPANLLRWARHSERKVREKTIAVLPGFPPEVILGSETPSCRTRPSSARC